jgi:DNA-binding NarL/FixJ family response regulator
VSSHCTSRLYSSHDYNIALILPQVAEVNTPPQRDAAEGSSLYDTTVTRVYIADALIDERSALRLILLDLNMEIAGEAGDWSTALSQAPISRTDILLVDWGLLPDAPGAALEELRKACPAALVIVLISHLDAHQQAALSAGADAFISKSETPDRVAEHLLSAAASVPLK